MSRFYLHWVFPVAALSCAFIYWWYADWWAYVDFPEGPMPKFIMPWWWQVMESGFVGVVGGSLLTGIWGLVCWSWQWFCHQKRERQQ